MKIGTMISLGAVFAIGMMAYSANNSLVGLDEGVNQSYAQVQNVLKRQADLIPNLAETAKGYASHEQATQIGVAAGRAGKAAAPVLNPVTGRPATASEIAADPTLQKKLAENAQVVAAAAQSALVSLNAVREATPDLKADKLFVNLMSQLEGSINRVTVERKRNQEAVAGYNIAIRQLPTKVFANLYGYTNRPYFEASAEEQSAPKLKF